MESLNHEIQLLHQLIRPRKLPEFHCFYQGLVKFLGQVVRGVDFQLVVAQGYYVFNIGIPQVLLSFEKSIDFPLGVILRQVTVAGPRRYYLYFLEYGDARRHEFLRTKLHPAISSISNNIRLAVLHAQLKHLLSGDLQHRQLAVDGFADASVRVEHTGRIDEACAQDGVVPVEYYHCLVHFRFLGRREPYLIIGESRQEIPPYLIRRLLVVTYHQFLLYFLILPRIIRLFLFFCSHCLQNTQGAFFKVVDGELVFRRIILLHLWQAI